jgi:hypothetical protein
LSPTSEKLVNLIINKQIRGVKFQNNNIILLILRKRKEKKIKKAISLINSLKETNKKVKFLKYQKNQMEKKSSKILGVRKLIIDES